MFFPILLLFLVATADACTPMKPTERDMSKGVCEDPDDMGICPDPTKTPKMTTTSALMTTTTTPTSTVTTSTSTTTSTTTTTTTKLPPNVCPAPTFTGQPDYTVDFNGKNFVLITDLANTSPYSYDNKNIAKTHLYRNHRVFEINENSAGNTAVTVYCYDGQTFCICDGGGNCYREPVAARKQDFINTVLTCENEGKCTVDGHMVGGSKKVYKDIQYLSCNVCADNVKLDNSAPLRPCYRTAAELQKMDTETCALGSEISSQVCKPDIAGIANTYVIESSLNWYYIDRAQRCRYRQGLDLMYLMQSEKEDEEISSFSGGELCVVTENHKHYSTSGRWALWQHCAKGECNLYAWLNEDSVFSLVNDPNKKYAYAMQKAAQAAGKTYDDPDEYVSRVVWIGYGPCTCNVK
ncbi:hypothetical protein QR680_011693 [Steinernema hermaphroditum]|uniref:C-type lectin domain-containing protein n=1 Tax=Steinernema hermaphroditum TaxID=289476 RepID=A0AA39I1W4_9BILA|nr:hypothetical protein QR680_011693 [Steinernema hermaphroditum]